MKKLFLSSLALALFLGVASSNCSAARRFFSADEDNALKQIVEVQGINCWSIVAQRMTAMGYSRNTRQCKERYENYLAPDLNKGPWTQAEDDLLMQLVNQHGTKWVSFKRFFNNRTNINLRNRYNFLIRHQIRGQFGRFDDSQESDAIEKANDFDLYQYILESAYTEDDQNDIF